MNDDLIVVAGGGGFIGGHLIAELRRQNYWRIRSIDIKPLNEWYQVFDDVDNIVADLKELDNCRAALDGCRSSTTWRPTWAAWGSSRTTRPCACCRC